MSARDVLAEIQARADQATEGPWVTFDTTPSDPFWNEIGYVSVDYPDDAEFIAAARADVPRLVKALTAALDLCDDAESFAARTTKAKAIEIRKAITAALGGDS